MKTRWDDSVRERAWVSVEEFPGWVNIRGSRYGRPVLKRDGCLQSLPICLSEMPDSLALKELSENIKRDMDSHKHSPIINLQLVTDFDTNTISEGEEEALRGYFEDVD